MATSQDFVNWVCSEALDPRFLMQALLAEGDHLRNFGKGTTHTTIYFPEVLAFHLNLPPLAEQRRIVTKVEALLAQVNAARERLAKVPLILKRFRQAVLEAACAGRLTGSSADDGELPPGWRLATVKELIAPGGIFDGPFGSNLKSSDYTDKGVRVVRLENLGNLRFIEDKRTFVSPKKYETLRNHTVKAGDILFGSFVDGAVRVCLMPHLDTPAIAKADCFCIRVRPDAVLREYLVLQLATNRTHDSLLEEVHGATRPRITTKQLRNVSVPICPPEEQKWIASTVQCFFTLANAIERRVQVTTVRAEKLPQAILAGAFSGELVLTEADLARAEGRAYEPASALIDRIRAGKAPAVAAASKRTRPARLAARSKPASRHVRRTKLS
jgi:type I restriction enzyme S subunit